MLDMDVMKELFFIKRQPAVAACIVFCDQVFKEFSYVQ